MPTLSAVVAVMGLGAAYTGWVRRPIGTPAFVVLNLLSFSLVFGNAAVAAIAVPLVLATLWWHARDAG